MSKPPAKGVPAGAGFPAFHRVPGGGTNPQIVTSVKCTHGRWRVRGATARQRGNWQPVPDFAGNLGVWHRARPLWRAVERS
jgi:hypothetical protein